MKRGSWSVESTIGLVFTIVIAVIVAMVLGVTNNRIDAMSCQLIDPHTGGVK